MHARRGEGKGRREGGRKGREGKENEKEGEGQLLVLVLPKEVLSSTFSTIHPPFPRLPTPPTYTASSREDQVLSNELCLCSPCSSDVCEKGGREGKGGLTLLAGGI